MQQILPENFFNYFKDCYELDHKAFTLDNLLSIKYKYKWFVEQQEELLTGHFPYIPYFNKKIIQLEKEIALYSFDKQLYYGAFFILGKNDKPLLKDKRFCAPLVLHPATLIKEDENTFLKINPFEIILNRSAINKLVLKKTIDSKESIIDEFLNYFSEYSQDAFTLKRIFDTTFENIDTSELNLYPKVWNESKIKNYFKKTTLEDNKYKIVPAAASVFINKSTSSQKVLVDLEGIANQNSYNTPIKELLFNTFSQKHFSDSYLKHKLNQEQYKALKNANKYNNSIIIGPPGTGKSYTISNIVVDAVLKEKSVLVVSKTKSSVEVLRNILCSEFNLKKHIIHTSGHAYKKSLLAKLNRYLSNIVPRVNNKIDFFRIEQLDNALKSAEEKFKNKIEQEIKINNLSFKKDKNFKEHLQHFFLSNWHNLDESVWDTFFEIELFSNNLQRDLKIFIDSKIEKNIQKNTSIYRSDLSDYFSALSSDSFSEYKNKIATINNQNILKVFPIWLAHLSELNAVIPQEKELFDLVIIDEATQCDIASALPAIYRAKQVIVAGDPNQLKHYSFVSKNQQQKLLNTYKLPNEEIFDYRNRSILDLYISKIHKQDQVSFLREHFRSTPSLIDFSNQKFYDNQLEIIKSTPEYTATSQIQIKYANGKRNEKGNNKIEAEAIIQQLSLFFEQFETIQNPPSIGIISLFNDQVQYINSLLKENYSAQTLKRFNILCGTAYQFQGSEREIILLSTVIDKHTHHSALNHANKPEVLNVAITRAKSEQYIFTSVTKKDLSKNSLLSQYLEFVEDYNYSDKIVNQHDQFQNDVIKSLNKKGYSTIICGYPVAGSVLDILVVHQNKKYFIDLIGYPGQYMEAFSIERYKTFSRTGIKCFPLHYSFWKKQPTVAFTRLINFIEKTNI